jgi:hypothetical protein
MSNSNVSRELSVGRPAPHKNSDLSHERIVLGLSEAGWRFVLVASMILLGAVSWAWSAGIGTNLRISDCLTSPHPIIFAPETEVTLMARRGSSCPVFVQRTVASVGGLQVLVTPHNGTLVLRGSSGVIYRPNKDFKGEDFFAFSMRTRLSNYVGTSVVRVRATVN